MSKGSRQRPCNQKVFDDNWDKIFKRTKAHNQKREELWNKCFKIENAEQSRIQEKLQAGSEVSRNA